MERNVVTRIYDSILDTIGNTPLVRAPRFSKGLRGELVFKLESCNPMSSVKDRPALAMIEDALEKGLIKENTTVIEPTSGNTGIALAMVCAVKGIKLIITMPDSVPQQRRKTIEALGARLILTDGTLGMKGAVAKAEELRDAIPNAFLAGQFVNPANPEIHRRTTGPEIWHDTGGSVDVFVAGLGSGGTVTGVGRYLKSKKPSAKVIAIEPTASAVLSGGKPGRHKIQGIGPGFVPEILDIYVIDEIMQVSDEDAIHSARNLCRHDGLMVGISSGAVAWAARQLAEREELAGQMIVGLLASHGERYLSTDLYS